LHVHRVERVAENKRKFCWWLASGLPHCCSWRDNVCLSCHPRGRGSPGQHG
jgi:hypothetical protein